MKQTSGPATKPAETVIKDIRRATRRPFAAEEKIRVVLEGRRGEDSIAEPCRREGIATSMHDGWSKEFLEAGKRRLAGDTARAATPDEVKVLRREASALKEVVAISRWRTVCSKRMARPVCKRVLKTVSGGLRKRIRSREAVPTAKMEIRAPWSS